MKKILLVVVAVLALSQTATWAAQPSVFVGIPNAVGVETKRVTLGPNSVLWASSYNTNGMPEATFQGEPTQVRVPLVVAPELEMFRTLHFRIIPGDQPRDPNRVRYSTSFEGEKSVSGRSDVSSVDLSGLGPGFYAVHKKLENDLGKKHLDFWIGKWDVFGLLGRKKVIEHDLTIIELFDPTPDLNRYVRSLEGSTSFAVATPEVRRLAIAALIKEGKLPGWEVPGLSYDMDNDTLYRQRQGIPPSLANQGVNWSVQVFCNGQPFMGAYRLHVVGGDEGEITVDRSGRYVLPMTGATPSAQFTVWIEVEGARSEPVVFKMAEGRTVTFDIGGI